MNQFTYSPITLNANKKAFSDTFIFPDVQTIVYVNTLEGSD